MVARVSAATMVLKDMKRNRAKSLPSSEHVDEESRYSEVVPVSHRAFLVAGFAQHTLERHASNSINTPSPFVDDESPLHVITCSDTRRWPFKVDPLDSAANVIAFPHEVAKVLPRNFAFVLYLDSVSLLLLQLLDAAL